MIKPFHILFCVLTLCIVLTQCLFAQEVSIPDPNLASAVRKEFRLPQDEPITKQLMQELTKLTAQRALITDLTGLEHAKNLRNLNLYGNEISDISALATLTELRELSLRSNQIRDISALAGMTDLETLFLGNNDITDIGPIAGLTRIEQLSLFSNQISDITALAKLTQLETLSLAFNKISDLKPLAGLTHVIELFLNNNEISDLTPLAGLTELEELYLETNEIDNLAPLGELTQLVSLSLDSNKIRFVSALTGLTNLESLYLTSNKINSISPLTALPNLEELNISDNPISDVFHIHELIAAGVTVDFETAVPHESQVAQTRILFNEIRNATDDKNDWVELRNISSSDIPLKEWEISILTREDDTTNNAENQDIDVVEFPDYTLPAGGVLLITNTDPNETTLLRGQNIRTPDIRRGAQHHYFVSEKLKLPNKPYLLYLRSARSSNDTLEDIEDVAGTYFHDKLTADQPLTQGTAWQRVAIAYVGYAVEAWGKSGYQAGVGYQPTAPKDTSHGTPGYHNDALVTDSRRGQISISEVMFTNTIGNRTASQWIELYNNSKTEAVNLTGWVITIESRHVNRNRHAVFTFNDLNVLPNQTMLLVSDVASKSTNLPDSRVYNFLAQPVPEYFQKFLDAKILSPDGFYIQISSPDGIIVDTVGNLDGDSQTQDTPAWELPAGTTESGARSSILRRYHENRLPFVGTEALNWRNASDVKLGKSTYFGDPNDVGNPGYTFGGVLPVTLSHFQAERTKIGVIIKWTTESEVDNAGFNIYRSSTKNGEFKIVNPTMIQGAGTTGERNEYTWTDTTSKPNTVYYYRIEDISFAGERKQLATIRLRGFISANGKFTTRWGAMKHHR